MSNEGKGILIRARGSSPNRQPLLLPESELVFTYIRSSGPGGQNVNKVATKVRLQWCPEVSDLVKGLSDDDRRRLLDRLESRLTGGGFIQVVSQRFRSRESNREACRLKLALLIRDGLKREKRRLATKPTRGSREKRLKEKKRVSSIKKMRGKPRLRDE